MGERGVLEVGLLVERVAESEQIAAILERERERFEAWQLGFRFVLSLWMSLWLLYSLIRILQTHTMLFSFYFFPL